MVTFSLVKIPQCDSKHDYWSRDTNLLSRIIFSLIRLFLFIGVSFFSMESSNCYIAF